MLTGVVEYNSVPLVRQLMHYKLLEATHHSNELFSNELFEFLPFKGEFKQTKRTI
jgi:hypothetical protein